MGDLDDPALLALLREERAYYDDVTAPLAALRAELEAEMRARVPDVEHGAPWEQDGWAYRHERAASAEHGRYVRRPAHDADAPWQELLDLDALAGPDGHVQLGVLTVAPDGWLLAYSVDTTGDERFDLRFRDLRGGTDQPDVVTGVHWGGAWGGDATSFAFLVPDDAWRPASVRVHRLGEPGGPAAATGRLLLHEPDETFDLDIRRTRSGALLVVTAMARDTTEQWVVPADDLTATPRSVAGRRPGIEYHVDHAPDADIPGGEALLVVTNDGAPEFRLVRAPLATPGPEHWEELIGEDPAERLWSVDVFADQIVLTLRREAAPVLRLVPRRGAEHAVDLGPGVPGGSLVLGHAEDYAVTHVPVRVESAVEPPAVHDVDLQTGRRTLRHRDEVPGHDPTRYRSERHWLPARDGTAIPVVVTHRADVSLDGTAPCLVWAYGAYESVDDPWFDPALLSLLDRGVVYVHAHVRGGGEVGRRWWEQGRLTRKPTSWHDLVDVADVLAGVGTEPALVDGRRIAIRGISAGGLLVAGALSERPDRFAAVVAEVPFVDVVTTMLDPDLPLTSVEWAEWGDPRTDAGYADLCSWSPYETVPSGPRPQLLVTGALHDTRVRVTEPAKWVARLRAADRAGGREPRRTIFRAEVGEGAHAGPTGRFARLAYEAELQAWLLQALGVTAPS
jgi:oligopeptidase B